MNIPKMLQGERGFWIVMAAGMVVVLLLLFGWALPAYQTCRNAENRLRGVKGLFDILSANRASIPSEQAVDDRQEFNDWLKGEADRVEVFFAGRAALVDDAICGGENVAPEDFKEAYKDAVQRQKIELQRHSREMTTDIDKAFPEDYEWITAPSLPSPSEYPAVRRAYWSRVYLYQRFLRGRVRTVKELRVQGTQPIPASDPDAAFSDFRKLPFTADLEVAPEHLHSFLARLLHVEPPGPDTRDEPVMQLTSFELRTLPSSRANRDLCSVSIEGYILVQQLPMEEDGA